MPASHAGNSPAVQAGIYCRISLAAIGDMTKVDDQERICRELADRLGWHVADVYQDHSRSAWQLNRKRPQWDRMLADVDAGRINGIIAYHGDRLVRQHEDLSALIRLSRSKGVRLASPTGTRDLDSYDDQFILEIECSMAKRESANTSRRRKQQYERYRREGRVRPGGPGGRSFGFETDNLTPRPAELELVREAADRILSGEAPHSVCRDWGERGLTPTTGKPWRTGNLIPMLKSPRYAGLMPDGESAAAWPAALDRETWERLRLVLDERGADQRKRAANNHRWLLSGLIDCGECGEPMIARRARRNVAKGWEAAEVYGCVSCRRVQRLARHLDDYVGSRVVGRLNNELNPDGLPMPVDYAAEWAVLEREQAATLARLRDFRTSAGTLDALAVRLDGIDARMAELRGVAAGSSRARLIERYRGTTREQWENELSLDIRRSLVAACFTVTVLRASKRGPGFRTEDVRVEPVS